jgi:DNA-directed RNA polymerase specialized sigma24 family protein
VDWVPQFDRDVRQLVGRICDRTQAASARDDAWRELMIQVAPHLEGWARRSRTLRRCRLTSDDDSRGVLVEVLRRLAAHDFEVLRAFLEQRPPTSADREDAGETQTLDRLVRLLGIPSETDGTDETDETDETEASHAGDTPFRAWLLKILDFAAKDHVRSRLGRTTGQLDAAKTKRATGTDAERLDALPEAAERPGYTDLFTLRKVLEEIRAVIATFPPPMQQALALWTEDAPFDVIASELSLNGAGRARDLVRAATARLRDRFRDRFPVLIGA